MSGRILTPAPAVGGMNLSGVRGGNNSVTPSHVNAFRIAAVVDRLALNMQKQQQQNQSKNDSAEIFNLCLSLARGIDFAIANHEIPSRAPDLPILLKQVCQCGDDPLLLAAVMVLMISVKNACQNGWFADKDSEDLNNFANEIATNFCTTMDFNTEPSSSNTVIAEIVSRFYPKMKMGQILTFLEVKPGFGAYVKDFQISKHLKHSPEEKIRLFVAQTDSTETSSCLINPPKVNFLLNGKGVDRRNSAFMDTGPQMPTNVTHLLKYGSNLLQAVGQFNGNYIIAVALMTELSAMENLILQDYVQPAAVIVDPDSELIVGPSRISLNCPISFRRIRTPVKGQSCKHFQCFDFDNYIGINSKRPSWRCPHCNHHCCYTEIRIDQNMVKVLKEVGENVNDVIISSDGSWKAIMESDDHAEKRQDKFPRLDQNEPDSSAPLDLMDLTDTDDAIVATGTCEAEDRKVLQNSSADQSSMQNMTSGPVLNSTNEVQQSSLPQVEDNSWSGIYLSTFHSGTTSAISDPQIGGNLEPSPVLTDTISSVPNSGVRPLRENPFLANSAPQTEITSPTDLQLQRFQYGNAAVTNEYGIGRSLSIPRHVSRTPVAVQALPAQVPTTISPRLRNSTSTFPLAASQTSALSADSVSAHLSNIERRMQYSIQPSVLQMPLMSSQQQHSNTRQDRLFFSGQPSRQVYSSQAVTQAQGAYQVSPGCADEVQNSAPRERTNLRVPHPTNQSTGRFQQPAQSSGTLFQSQSNQGGFQGVSTQAVGGTNLQHHRALASAQRAAQTARAFQNSRPAPSSGNADSLGTSSVGDRRGGIGNTPQSIPRSDVGVNLTADQDWRPTGRMRGSLSGQAYSAALNQYIIQPTQQAQAARTPSSLNSSDARTPASLNSSAARTPPSLNSSAARAPPNAPSSDALLQILMANRTAMQAANSPTTGLAAMSSAAGSVTPQSPGLQ